MYMIRSLHLTRYALTLILSLGVLAGCGGGGGGGGGGGETAPVENGSAVQVEVIPTVATETPPKGPLVDTASMNLMPIYPAGATWNYTITDDQGNSLGTGNRTINAFSGSTARLIETNGENNDVTMLVQQADGVYVDYSQEMGFPDFVQSKLGLVRAYAFPTYAIGEARIVVRKGEWAEDLDGDSRNEQFAFEYEQTFRGFETVEVYGVSYSVARFSNSYRFTLTGSRYGVKNGYNASEEIYLAPGMGPLKFVRYVEDLNGIVTMPRQTWLITSLQVGAKKLENPIHTHTIALPHRAVVYDASRNLYYASIPSSVTGNGNSIARINPENGSVTYSAAIGSNPGTLALSADYQYLYVGLEDAGQVVKLKVPAMSEVTRVGLGGDAFYGTRFAETIAVSPINPDNFAVAMRFKGVSPRHAGVAMFYDTVMAPNTTQGHTGSNQIAFRTDGQLLFGSDTESSMHGLSIIAVASTGLTEQTVNTIVASGRQLEYLSDRLYVGSSVFSATDLTLLGRFTDSWASCRPMPLQDKAVCTPYTGTALTVHSLTSFVKLADVPLNIPYYSWSNVYNVTAGPAGQVAVSYGDVYGLSPMIYLVTHPLLR
ncbi:MAG TPA: hypothetical protein VJ654_09585 [Noviherbaspirillum sp.]|nr:hypothetical protein [Noviherbaspirillum sp.]